MWMSIMTNKNIIEELWGRRSAAEHLQGDFHWWRFGGNQLEHTVYKHTSTQCFRKSNHEGKENALIRFLGRDLASTPGNSEETNPASGFIASGSVFSSQLSGQRVQGCASPTTLHRGPVGEGVSGVSGDDVELRATETQSCFWYYIKD